jgi:hypothetical protein
MPLEQSLLELFNERNRIIKEMDDILSFGSVEDRLENKLGFEFVLNQFVMEPLSMLIQPWDPEKHSWDFIFENYNVSTNVPYPDIRMMPKERKFIFDNLGHFYQHHNEEQYGSLSGASDHFLYTKDNENITSIVIGNPDRCKVPLRFYLYMEAGTRKPEYLPWIEANQKISEQVPVLYIAFSVSSEFKEQTKFMLPKSFFKSDGNSSA